MAENAEGGQKPPETPPADDSAKKLAELEAQLAQEKADKAALEQQLQDMEEFKLPDDEGSTEVAERLSAMEQRLAAQEEKTTAAERRAAVAEAALKHPNVPRTLIEKGGTSEEMDQIAQSFTEAVQSEAQKLSDSLLTEKEKELRSSLGEPIAGTIAPLGDDVRQKVAQIEQSDDPDKLEKIAQTVITAPKPS